MALEKTLSRLVNSWKRKVLGRSLRQWADDIYSEVPGICTETEHPGTLFKLLFLWSYVRYPYLHIQASQRKRAVKKYRKAMMFYIDMYAGCVINQLRLPGKLIRLLGSPALSILASIDFTISRKENYLWDLLILNEYDSQYRSMLRERLEVLLKKAETTIGKPFMPFYVISDRSTNEALLNIRKTRSGIVYITGLDCTRVESWRRIAHILMPDNEDEWIHGLVFIDPPSPSTLPIEGLKEVLRIPSDIIILAHKGIFAEHVLKRSYSAETLSRILGLSLNETEDLIRSLGRREALEELYVNRLKEVICETPMVGVSIGSKKRNFVQEIPIKTRKYHYALLVATRQTGGESTWHGWVQELSQKLSGVSELGLPLLDIVERGQTRLF